MSEPYRKTGNMKCWIAILAAFVLSACASYSGSGLKPEQDGLEDVLRTMGKPAMQWRDTDGSIQLSYPRGPSSTESFMVRIGKNGKLQSIRNVLVPETIALIKPGMAQNEVLRILGPSEPTFTIYFKARDELVWDWRYQAEQDLAHFLVLFDGTKGTVRCTMILVDMLPTPF